MESTWDVREASPSNARVEALERGVVTGLLWVGLLLRARGFLFKTEPFWLDECTWAKRLLTRPLAEFEIRPIGFMAATRGLVHLFGATEAWFRLLPWCAGVAILLLTPLIGRRLLASGAARLLLLAIVALHPGAIDLAKEFKPYSVGLAIHGALVLFGLRYAETGLRRDLLPALLLAIAGVLFAQDVLFAYPGLFVALALCAWRARRWSHLGAVVAAGAAAFSLVLGLYWFFWRGASTPETAEFWAHKYDVFFEAAPGGSRFGPLPWFAGKYVDVAALPGMRREFWTAKLLGAAALEHVRSLDNLIWLALNLAGLAQLVRKRLLVPGLLLVVPLVTLTLFSALRFWPYGSFRTNLFLLAYTAPIAALGLDLLVGLMALRPSSWGFDARLLCAPAAVLVALPLLAFDPSLGGDKRAFTATSQFTTAMRRLLKVEPIVSEPREEVVFDGYACREWDFYSRYHRRFSRQPTGRLMERFSFAPYCRRDGSFGALLADLRRKVRAGGRVWLVAEDPETMDDMEHAWPRDLAKREHLDLSSTTARVFEVGRGEPSSRRRHPRRRG